MTKGGFQPLSKIYVRMDVRNIIRGDVMNGLRKREKLSVVQLFTLIIFTHVKPVKFTSVRT